jgi:hypothetical protein
MQNTTRRALVSVRQATGRWGLRGAVVGGEVALLALAASVWYYSLPTALAAAALGGAAGALALAAIAFVMQLRRRTLSDVEKDLEKAVALLERGLIDEEDYRQIKREVLEQRRSRQVYVPPVVNAALVGAALGMAIPLWVMSVEMAGSVLSVLVIAGGASVAGGTAAGGTAAAITAISHSRAAQIPPPNRPLLDR